MVIKFYLIILIICSQKHLYTCVRNIRTVKKYVTSPSGSVSHEDTLAKQPVCQVQSVDPHNNCDTHDQTLVKQPSCSAHTKSTSIVKTVCNTEPDLQSNTVSETHSSQHQNLVQQSTKPKNVQQSSNLESTISTLPTQSNVNKPPAIATKANKRKQESEQEQYIISLEKQVKEHEKLFNSFRNI